MPSNQAPPNTRSLRVSLMRLLAMVTAFALGSVLAGSAFIKFRQLQQDIHRTLVAAATAGGASASAAIVFHDRQEAARALAVFLAYPEIEAVALYTPEGRRLADSGKTSLLPIDARGLRDHTPELQPLSRTTTLFMPVLLDGERIGSIYLQASLDAHWKAYFVESVLMSVGILLAFILALLLGRRFIDRFVLPIRRLADLSREVRRERNFSLRAPGASSASEIQELIESFNAMLSEVETRNRELANYHGELERMVFERTEALTQTNQRLMEAKGAAEAATEAKARFLANMSHEIRTPANAVIGAVQLLETPLEEEKRRLLMRTLSSSAEALLSIIDDILDFSKAEAQKMVLDHIAFDLRSVVPECLGMVAPYAQAKGIALVADVSPDFPDAAIGDPGRLRQILVNLLSNAVKFTEKGEVVLSAAPVFDAGRNAFGAVFRVRDTGIGVPAAERERIFEAFSQADGTSTRRYGGTGLGLNIARQLARLMGGDVRIEEAGGQGASFVAEVRLDSIVPESEAERTSSPSEAEAFRGRVIVAEDHPPNQLVIREMLELMGVEVSIAADGHEALALAQSWAPDLIFMDCRMPGMDGYEAAERLRAWERDQPQRRSCPIVAITASALPDERRRCLNSGMDDLLSKPILAAGLRKILARWLGKDRVFDARLLDELRAHMRPDSFDRFLRKIEPQQREGIASIRAAVEKGDAEEAARLLHTLKGGSAYVGGIELAELCKTFEAAALAGDLAGVAERLPELAAAGERLLRAIDGYLGEGEPGDSSASRPSS